MGILQMVFLLSVCGCPQALSLAISDILEVAKLSKDVVNDVLEVHRTVYGKYTEPKVKGDILIKNFNIYNKKMDMLQAQFEGMGSRLLYGLVVHTHIQSQLKWKLLKARKNINLIYLKYTDMVTLLNMTDNSALGAFARSIVSHSHSSLQGELDIIHTIIAPSEDGVPSVFHILDDIMKEPGNELFCNMQTSTQQLVLYLYEKLALTELKGFLMMEFSYMLLGLHNKGNFEKEFEATHERYERYKHRTATTLKLTMEAVKVADLAVWKCDPFKQVKNKTYIAITELLHGYIEFQKNLNDQRSCNKTCHHLNYNVTYNCFDIWDGLHLFCTKNRQCKGKMVNCHFISDATVCHAGAGTNRRSEYIEHIAGGPILSLDKECAYNYSSSLKEGLQGLTKCDYCMCLCDEQGVNSDRFFNLRSSESHRYENMVVTGLRFVKKNRIIHLQIQEGKLLPRGQINLTTIHWNPVDDYRIDDDGVLEGRDYHTLKWNNRSFDLDDIVTKDEELITGVKFRMVGTHLKFSILVTSFNFTDGTLKMGSSHLLPNEISENRKKINLDNKDIPIRSPDHSLPLSQNGMYLEFTPTDVSMDLAQTTVPFLDAQAVVSSKPVPLCGAGVSYKGSKHFGGFIYPKIITYNYSRLFLNAHDDTLN